VLHFRGFSASATMTASADYWTITDGARSERFRLVGVTSLVAGVDYMFIA